MEWWFVQPSTGSRTFPRTVNGPYGDLPVAYMMKCVSPVEYEK